MIAACPKCQTRYRVDTDRLGPDGARLRCSQCSAVFRVRLSGTTPAGVAPAAAPAPAAVASAPPSPIETPRAPLAQPAPRAAGGASLRDAARAVEPEPSDAAEDRSAAAALPAFAGERAAVSAAARRAPPPTPPDGPTFDRPRLVLVAHPDPDACKQLAEALEVEGLQVLVAHDGVEAILSIQRALPRAVALDAALPKMFGFQVCEIVKRNESLRAIHVCLMGSIHKDDRYRRAPHELYGADFYTEPPDLPGALIDWLARVDLPLRSRSRSASPPVDPAAPRTALADEPIASALVADPPAAGAPAAAREPVALAPRAEPARVVPVTPAGDAGEVRPPPRPLAPAPARVAPADPLAAERAQAERLARIIVSDIVLYNEEKFAAAVRSGNAREALRDELEEGRALFRERIDARIRDERDFLADELERVARARGMA